MNLWGRKPLRSRRLRKAGYAFDAVLQSKVADNAVFLGALPTLVDLLKGKRSAGRNITLLRRG